MSLANVIALYMFYKEHLSSSKPYLKKNFQEILNFLSKLSALQMFISVHRLESPHRVSCGAKYTIAKWLIFGLCSYTCKPSEEFELTANPLGAHIETHGGLILRTLSYLTVNSQDDSHCELAVSFP